MNCVDLMSNDQKLSVTSQTIQNNANLQKLSKYNELHRFDVKTIKNVELRRKPFKTTQNYKSDQITMNCIDLTSKRSKMLSYVANHSKLRKSKKVIKIQWIASIWCQNDKKCWVTSKPFETQQNYKSDQIKMNCIDLMWKQSKQRKTPNAIKLRWICVDLTLKRSKMFNCVAIHSKQLKSTKVIKLQWIASIWCQTIKNVELRRKPFKTTQIYKSYQSTMNCIDLMSKL